MADSLTLDGAPGAGAAGAKPAKKGGKLKKLLVPLVLLLAGVAGGVAAATFVAPMLAAPADPAAPKARAPRPQPLTYIEIDNSFTANLRGSGRFVQLKIAVATHGGADVAKAIDTHRIALIAAVLGVLAETTPDALEAPGGREALATRMRMAINDLLIRKAGVAGVDDVLFTNFIIQ